jgi:hypothetical protein
MPQNKNCKNISQVLCGLTEDSVSLAIKCELKPIKEFTMEQMRTNDRFSRSLYTEAGEDKIRMLEDKNQQAIGRKHLYWSMIAAIPLISALVALINHFWK